MDTMLRLFKPNDYNVAVQYDGVNIPIPHISETVFIDGMPYKVKDVSYDWFGSDCLVDVETMEYDEPITVSACDDKPSANINEFIGAFVELLDAYGVDIEFVEED